MVSPNPYKLDLKNRLKAKGRGERGNLEPLAFCHLNSNYLKWRLYFPSFVQILVTAQVVRFKVHSFPMKSGLMVQQITIEPRLPSGGQA